MHTPAAAAKSENVFFTLRKWTQSARHKTTPSRLGRFGENGMKMCASVTPPPPRVHFSYIVAVAPPIKINSDRHLRLFVRRRGRRALFLFVQRGGRL
jgi:hypothetical protein